MAKKGRLSNDDFQLFKENIHLSDEELADKLNRTVSFIEKTRKRVFPNKKTGRWSKDEITKLEKYYGEMTTSELARLLNRTEKSVASKIETEIESVVEEFVEELTDENVSLEEIKEDVREVLEDKIEEVKEKKLNFFQKIINFFKNLFK